MKILSSKLFATISIITVVLLIAALANWFQYSADEAVLDATRSELEKNVEQVELRMQESLAERGEDLSSLAKAFSDAEVSEDTAADFLSTQFQAEKFDGLYYVDLDGKGVSASGDEFDFSDHEIFADALSGEYLIVDAHISEIDGTVGFEVVAPIEKGGTIAAFLVGQVSTDALYEILESFDYDSGDAFVVDTGLNLFFSTGENHIGVSEIPQSDADEIGQDNIAMAQSNIASGQGGSFYYDYYGVHKTMVYLPISHTELALALNVESGTVNPHLSGAVNQLKFMCQLIFWVLVVLIVYIWVSQRHLLKKMQKTAYYDQLTGLSNMEKFKIDVEKALKQHPEKKYTMQKMDIAKFSAINELYGTEVGNKVLLTIADVMKDISANTEKSFICARVGADDFLMFAANGYLENEDTARYDSEKEFISLIPELLGYDFRFRYGRYFVEPGERDAMEIINKVTLAHNMARTHGYQKTWDYDDAYRQEIRHNAEINNKRKAALENGEFKVFLQPKFSVHEDKLIGAEALVRWIQADGSMIYPNDFVPLFERNGFIVELDKHILENVCMTIQKWMSMGFGAITVSVNCSRLNLVTPYFVEGIVAITDKYNVPHEYIEIELTESAAFGNEHSIQELFARLREHGFKISIDDFGSGYSSLGMLKNLHVDTLKMDRSFFVDGKSARRDDMLIDGVVKLAHNLGMYVVAEGIETKEQIELLRSMNCDAVQGYFYAKPMPISEFEQKYSGNMALDLHHGKQTLPLIHSINDAKFANSIVPCGILVSLMDENFTIVEANDGYFDIIGYSREEVRDIYKNSGMALIHPEDMNLARRYFIDNWRSDFTKRLEYACRVITKDKGCITIQTSCKVSQNENGEYRIYFSLMDVTIHSENLRRLKEEQNFNARIAGITNNAFFDYDMQADTIRFSKNFASRFDIPDVIENFLDSDLGQRMFSACVQALENRKLNKSSLPIGKSEGELCLSLPGGEPVWYLFSYEAMYNEDERRHKIVGKLTEAAGHKLEMDILKVKSEGKLLTNVYNKSATERYIRNYLKLAIPDNKTGAFFVIELGNFEQMCDELGASVGDECIKDVGTVLRNMFRSADLIGRSNTDKFFVLVNNYKTLDFAKRKALNLCEEIGKTYEKDGVSIKLSVAIGVSLYPEHGDTFESVYEKSLTALRQIKPTDKEKIAVYNEDEQ